MNRMNDRHGARRRAINESRAILTYARVESADVNIKEPLNGGAQRTIILAWMEERNFKRAAIVKERASMSDAEMTSTRN